MTRAMRLSFVLCQVLSSTIFIAKADTVTPSSFCKKTDQNALRSMKSIEASKAILVKFNEDCKNDICLVQAQLADNTNIATFVLDPRSCFTISDEIKTFDTDSGSSGCARHYTLDYQYVSLNDDARTGSTLIFETVQAEKSDGRVCWQPDTNDGPALATFNSSYETMPQATIYVYELDGYRTIQEAIRAKTKYTQEMKR